MNLANDKKYLPEGLVLADVFEVCELQEDYADDRREVQTVEAMETVFEKDKIDINPKLTPEKRTALLQLLSEFKDRFAWNQQQIGKTNLAEMAIPLLDETPIHQPPYRVSHREREIIRDQVKEMLKKGVIRESSSAFALPVVLVRKKNDEWRFCVDYRKLNNKII